MAQELPIYTAERRFALLETSAMGCSVEVPVFTDTNMGTHVALCVSPDIKGGDFMRELEKTHFNCFPELGEIRAFGLMVKRKLFNYHLSESVPIKYAFQGLKGTWFLHTEVSSLYGSDLLALSNHVTAETKNRTFDGSNATDPVEPKISTANAVRDKNKRKGNRQRRKRYHCLKVVQWGLVRTVCFSRKNRRKRGAKSCFPACRIEDECPGSSKNFSGPSSEEKSGDCKSWYEEEYRKEWTRKTVECSSERNEEHRKEWISKTVECPSESNQEHMKERISKMVECPSERSSEVVSVTGIINRYFSDLDCMNYIGSPSSSEVTSRVHCSGLNEQFILTTDGNHSNIRIVATPPCTIKTPVRDKPFAQSTDRRTRASRRKPKEIEVGQRLVTALSTLGVSSSKQRTSISISRLKNGRLLGLDSSLVRSLVFEMSDDDDDD